MPAREIIRNAHEDQSLRKVAADRPMDDVIHPDGGLLIRNGSEEAQCLFDSTCRKPHRFLSQPVPASDPRIPGRGQYF